MPVFPKSVFWLNAEPYTPPAKFSEQLEISSMILKMIFDLQAFKYQACCSMCCMLIMDKTMMSRCFPNKTIGLNPVGMKKSSKLRKVVS